ncbi:MAG: DUF2513 domain-containing protein [Rhodobacteraceae bacterium]|uniref:DUF2513 domain-containing protein n=1 Tax=Celeribacter ethanolicus TaxID=1758178 RepID=UPI00082C017A|nr:DUF2513 domain-containing protein [Celeribacter ethanolicus]NVK45096.1 DUF2513 domain-containing protein [Paracoccaceae bacterium]
MPKRDLNRIRELLLKAEARPLEPDDDFNDGYLCFDETEISPEDGYQLLLMKDAGLIEGRDASTGLFRITNVGHDYLDAIRNEGIWSDTKNAVAETGGSVTLEVVKSLATGFLKKKISQHTGIEL